MTPSTANGNVAVVCERGGPDGSAMENYLRSRGIPEATWYAPRDVEEADAALRGGSVLRVIFPRLGVFLDALWEERLTASAWTATDVRIEFVDPPAEPEAALVRVVVAEWSTWQRRRRRARAIAGVLLSLIAGAAAFLLLWLCGRP